MFARNLMREVEIFIPLSLLGTAGFADGGDQWIVLFTLVWVGIFLLMPLFNKDCMRVGDIVGGTWVIAAPMSVLLPDMARTNSSPLRRGPAGPAYAFKSEQLDIYGIYELQTLEEVLRDQGLLSEAASSAAAAAAKSSSKSVSGPELARPSVLISDSAARIGNRR